MRRLSSARLASFAALILVCVGLTATLGAKKAPPVITAAAPNAGQTMLFIVGENFDAQSVVYLGGLQLGGVVVNGGGTAISVPLPPGAQPGT